MAGRLTTSPLGERSREQLRAAQNAVQPILAATAELSKKIGEVVEPGEDTILYKLGLLQGLVDEVQTAVGNLGGGEQDILDGVTALDGKADTLLTNLASLAGDIAALQSLAGTIDGKADAIATAVASVDGKVDAQDAVLATIDGKLDDLAADLAAHRTAVESA